MKMRKRLDSNLVCQSVKMKHYGFLYREIQENLTIKSKSTVSKTYLCSKKRNSDIAKKPTGRLKKYSKRKNASDQCLKESHGEFGKYERTLQLILYQRIHFEADSSKDFKDKGN